MKIQITAKPGELEARLKDVIKAITEMAGGELCKSDPEPQPAYGDHGPRPFEHQAIQQALDRAQTRHVDRIQQVMQSKIMAVLRTGE